MKHRWPGAAHHWIDQFHIDGMRVDAVAAMIYKNFGKEEDGDAIMAGKAADQEREREDSLIWGKYKLDIVTHKCSWLGLPWTSKSTKESSRLCRAKSTRMASLCFGVFVLRCVADTLVYCFPRKSPPISSGLLIRNQVHGFWWSVSMSGYVGVEVWRWLSHIESFDVIWYNLDGSGLV